MDANLRRNRQELFIENLQPKMPFHVRVRAINSAGQSQWVLMETETKEEKWGDAFRGHR